MGANEEGAAMLEIFAVDQGDEGLHRALPPIGVGTLHQGDEQVGESRGRELAQRFEPRAIDAIEDHDGLAEAGFLIDRAEAAGGLRHWPDR